MPTRRELERQERLQRYADFIDSMVGGGRSYGQARTALKQQFGLTESSARIIDQAISAAQAARRSQAARKAADTRRRNREQFQQQFTPPTSTGAGGARAVDETYERRGNRSAGMPDSTVTGYVLDPATGTRVRVTVRMPIAPDATDAEVMRRFIAVAMELLASTEYEHYRSALRDIQQRGSVAGFSITRPQY